MLDSSRDALLFVRGKRREDLDGDRQLQLALVRCIEVIGEAAARITAEFRDAHPEIPWRPIVGTRNRLIHAYFDVNLNVIWQTAREELPALEATLVRILVQFDA